MITYWKIDGKDTRYHTLDEAVNVANRISKEEQKEIHVLQCIGVSIPCEVQSLFLLIDSNDATTLNS